MSSLNIKIRIRTLATLTFFSILGSGCAQLTSQENKQVSRNPATVTPDRCLAIRGNGELIMSHFSSLAAITEHFGLFEGLAGGSSASLSMFVYESILQNPAIHKCGNSDCSPEQSAANAALLLKSVYSYIGILQNSPTGHAALQLYENIRVLQKQFKDSGASAVNSITSVDPRKILELQGQFSSLLQNPSIKAILNPRTIDIMVHGKGDSSLGLRDLTNSPKDLAIKLHRLKDFYNAVQTFGAFSADTKSIFFRPSLVSFDQLAQNMGLIANFYAGRGNLADSSDYDQAGLNEFVAQCATPAKNLSWYAFAEANPECKNQIANLIQKYNQNHTNRSVAQARVHDKVGQYLHILASTAVIPNAADTYREVARSYLNATGAGYSFKASDFQVFNDIQFGYFGSSNDIDRMLSNARTSEFKNDYKMQRARGFKDASWEEILNYSPAEPGLSALTLPEQLKTLPGSAWANGSLPMVADPNDVMAAGWSDLTPTFALRNMGCKEVLYITRREPESSFAQGLVQRLGATQAQVNELYNLNADQNPPSSFANALKAADGVWCTDWNAADLEIPHAKALDHDAYLETQLETDSAAKVSSMLLNPNDPFRARITGHRYQGCGGNTPVTPGHLHGA